MADFLSMENKICLKRKKQGFCLCVYTVVGQFRQGSSFDQRDIVGGTQCQDVKEIQIRQIIIIFIHIYSISVMVELAMKCRTHAKQRP